MSDHDAEIEQRLQYILSNYGFSSAVQEELKWFANHMKGNAKYNNSGDDNLTRWSKYFDYIGEDAWAERDTEAFEDARNDITDELADANEGEEYARSPQYLKDILDAQRVYFQRRYPSYERSHDIKKIIHLLRGVSGIRTKPPNPISSMEMLDMVREAQNPRNAFLVYLLFEAGMRPGELRNIRWDDVEEDDEEDAVTIKFRSAEKPEVNLRTVTVTGAYPLFKEWQRRVRSDYTDSEYLFVTINGGRGGTEPGEKMKEGTLLKAVKELGNEVGLDSTPSDFRHSCTTYWAYQNEEHGLPMGSIMSRLGWKKKDTFDNYRDDHEAYERKNAREAGNLPVEDDLNIHRTQRCPRCEGIIYPVDWHIFGNCRSCDMSLGDTLDPFREFIDALDGLIECRLMPDFSRQDMLSIMQSPSMVKEGQSSLATFASGSAT